MDNEAFVLADVMGIGQEEGVGVLHHVMKLDLPADRDRLLKLGMTVGGR